MPSHGEANGPRAAVDQVEERQGRHLRTAHGGLRPPGQKEPSKQLVPTLNQKNGVVEGLGFRGLRFEVCGLGLFLKLEVPNGRRFPWVTGNYQQKRVYQLAKLPKAVLIQQSIPWMSHLSRCCAQAFPSKQGSCKKRST